MQPISLFGSGIKSYSEIVTSQRRLNCFYEVRSDGDKSVLVVRGTPGTQLAFTLATNVVRGWRVVGDLLFIVAGAILYSVTDAYVATVRGVITAGANNVGISDNGVELIVVDGTAGFILNLTSYVLSTIVDGNFPNGAVTVSFLNGRFQVENPDTRRFYVSASYAGATWTPVIFATKENSSDPLVAVQVLNGTLILFGTNSMEFWQDVGASPVPYTRINGTSQTWGLAAVSSRSELSNTLVFLGQNPQGTVQVLKLNGYKPERISTSDVENIINTFVEDGVDISDAVSLTYMVDGHPMYQLTFPSGDRSFLYDDLSQIWQEVQTGIALTGRHVGNLGIAFNSLNYVSDADNGNVYQLSMRTYTDNGAPIKRQIVSKHVRNGGNPFSIDELYLDIETGVGLQSGQGSNPQIVLQVSKDGGRTFGQERWKSIGAVGQYRSPRAIWNCLGQAVDFVFKFTMTDPVKFIVTSAFAKSSDDQVQENVQ